MKNRIVWLCLYCALLLISPMTSAQHISPTLTASHQWLSTSSEDEHGLFAVTYSFTLSNTGLDDLSNLNFQLHSPTLPLINEPATIALSQLPAGASQTVEFTLTTPLPVDGNFPAGPMWLQADMTTPDGEVHSSGLLSEGGNN